MGVYYTMSYDTLVRTLALAELSAALRDSGDPRPVIASTSSLYAISKLTSEDRSRLVAINGYLRCRKGDTQEILPRSALALPRFPSVE